MANFNVGDKVNIYSHTFLPMIGKGIVTQVINEEYIKVKMKHGFTGSFYEDTFFKKQCRKLVKKKNTNYVHDVGKFMDDVFKKQLKEREKLVKKKSTPFSGCLIIDDPLNKEEKPMTFDPTKPCKIKGFNYKVEFITELNYGYYPLIFKITDMAKNEFVESFAKNGQAKHNPISQPDFTRSDLYDLINIPEPKPLNIHVGGVYKNNNDGITICLADIESDDHIKLHHFNNIGHPIEHLFDLQDCHEYVKEKLK